MGQPSGKNRKGSKSAQNNLKLKKSFRTKRRKKDIDNIREDMLNAKVDNINIFINYPLFLKKDVHLQTSILESIFCKN